MGGGGADPSRVSPPERETSIAPDPPSSAAASMLLHLLAFYTRGESDRNLAGNDVH